jgi:F-type H+-transporting ATPase subunit b
VSRRTRAIVDAVGPAVWIAMQGSIAFAAETAHGEHHAPSIGTLVLPVINFSIFAFILARFAWPAIVASLADRRKTVERQIGEAETALREARASLEQIEGLRARSREDGEKLVAEFRQEGETQAGSLLTSARRMAERLRRDAELLAQQEKDRAAHEIRSQVADLVIRRATVLVRQRFGEPEQRRAVEDFLSEVGS